eukprot:TRINITY_DN6275_c0_g1_i1.p1 TRINITY_DN6275_c0_g1~~TRINITY_DN6275_c0_g1_i1.p1  ORF type:complete len:762 (+),score=202.93 TRINITY_DN6275_c0_g1_i1:69-2354(+)
MSACVLEALAGTCAAGLVTAAVSKKSTYFIGKDEQLLVHGFTDTEVVNGPARKMLLPGTYRSAEIRKAETLGTVDYVKIKDSTTGAERIERGPRLLFLGPYEKVAHQGTGTSLGNMEYMLVSDWLSGAQSIVRGPTVWFPTPYENGTKGSAISLTSTEYVLVHDKKAGEKHIVKGPLVWFPEPQQEGRKMSGITVSSTEYVLVEDRNTGERRIDKGPCVWFPAAQEEGKKASGISLSSTEYIIVEDKLTGKKSMVKGPRVWFPEPYEAASDVMEAIALQTGEYIKLKDMASGQRMIRKGEDLIFLEPTWEIEMTGCATKGREAHGIRNAWVLKSYEYVRLIDKSTGKIIMHKGEKTVYPEPGQEVLDSDKDKLSAIDLKVNEYVKILDQSSGAISVRSGPDQVFLGPYDMTLDGGKKKAIEVDEEHAVLVRDKKTGQLRLVTEKQLFVPGAHEAIEKVRELTKLEEHEAMIVKDQEGRFRYYYGSPGRSKEAEPSPPSFFLPPYAEIVRLNWSRGRRREKRDLYIDRFDCRAQYMSFEFNCRTKDNVELVLEGTFFWEVVDLPLMVRTTGDTSGDICNHARSQFIKKVAQVTLEQFMNDLNTISSDVYKLDSKFYSSRGVMVHSLEVTGYHCAEESTSAILQQIIEETTNRMNRISQQESQNDVKLKMIEGSIVQEKANTELLEIKHEHAKKEAMVAGSAEAARVQSFVNGLAKEVPKLDDRVAMWQTLRKTEALSVLAQGSAQVYFTPNDVNLSIESRQQ